ncbi:MAG TPA: hypothetical protein VMG82_28880 [Candidatus Sulfotelmatobacter sp.]|nr:hypothetical protein [Candidatus Sulfotelmatobacter sp.]
MRVLARFLIAAGAGLLVLLVGVLGATILGGFAVLERNAPPGNTFLVLEFIAIGVLICAPLAIVTACWVLLRTGNNANPALPPSQSGLFLRR